MCSSLGHLARGSMPEAFAAASCWKESKRKRLVHASEANAISGLQADTALKRGMHAHRHIPTNNSQTHARTCAHLQAHTLTLW